MMEQLRQRLKTWLNGPLPSQPTALSLPALSLLQDRMDFLEKRLNQVSVPFKELHTGEPVVVSSSDATLEQTPDAHLGAH